MTVAIRRLNATDSVAELTALLHAAYASLSAMGFNYTAVDQSEDVTRERNAGGECYVAVDDRRLLGTILMVQHPHGSPWLEQPHVAEFGQFGVLPALQGQGIGTRLMSFAERWTVAKGASELALNTSEGAHHLVRWYERMGYRLIEHVQWKGKTYRSVIMSKSLGPA